MVYSRWRPDKGGYDYFEASERRGLGDDMPVPQLTIASELGVASTDAGRSANGGLRHAGAGPLPRGAILPLSRSGLAGTGLGFNLSLSGLATLALGALAGFWLGRRWRR